MTFVTTQVDMLMQRGTYFFCKDEFGFTDGNNLALAAAAGAAGVIGARVTGPLSRRMGAKRTLFGLLLLRIAVCLAQAAVPEPAMVVVGVTISMFCCFAAWPIIESYISAGVPPAEVSKRLGRFNITWGVSAPLGMALAGPIIHYLPRGLFALAAVLSLVILWLALPLERQPEHLPEDHEHRPRGKRFQGMRSLMIAGRWSLVGGTMLSCVMVPLMPGIFAGMSISVVWATALAAVVDVTRVSTFYMMRRWSFWHERAWILVLVVIGLPLGLVMVVLPGLLAPVLIGQAICGATFAVAYYSALYYAMILHNASVDASGAHEGTAAAGLVVGPCAAMVGGKLGATLTPATLGAVLGVAPAYAVCAAASCIALIRAARNGKAIEPASQD